MYSREARFGGVSFGGLYGGAPPPKDLLILLGVVFVTFSMQFFASTAALIAWLRLTPAVYIIGALWQLVTYPFIGIGEPSLWFLLGLLILFWFGRDVFWTLGRRRFWRLLVGVSFGAGLVAVLVHLLTGLAGGYPGDMVLLQGQQTLLLVLVAAFATLYRDATIYLFFVLPVRAGWFLWLEVLFSFLGFLSTKDLAGFVGSCMAVFLTYNALASGRVRAWLHRAWLHLRHWRYRAELARMRRKRGNIRLVRNDPEDDDSDDDHRDRDGRGGSWVH